MATGSRSTGLFNIFGRASDKNVRPPPNLVIAIDIGTFSSGYSVQWRQEYETNPQSPYISKFPVSIMCTHKNSTALLLTPDKRFKAFGYEAETQFDSLGTEGKDSRDRWYFVRHFKMMLYHRENVTEETPVEASDGKNLPVLEVFSSTIRYMKDHALDYLVQNTGDAMPETDVKWVITVPAIWDDPVKRVMRMSAEKAGIPSENLCIGIEPECAALHCSQVPLTELLPSRAQDKSKSGFTTIPGFTVMIVDMGGGTVDITTLKMLKGGTMEYVFKSGGGPWGGTYVNEKFLLLLVDVVGDDVMKDFADKHAMDVHNLQRDFELQKRALKPPSKDDSEASFELTLPTSLKDLWEQKAGMLVSDILANRTEPNDITLSKNTSKLVFKPDLIRNFMKQTIAEIINYVKDTLNQSTCRGEKIDLLMLVGGFAESSLVVKSIREQLQSLQIPVARPKDPELAVLKGAVLYGHNENAIVSRKLRYSYGIGMVMEFDEAKHDASKRFEAEGKIWASDVFRKHATIGQEVRIGEWMLTKEYYPIDKQQRSVQVYVFTSERENPVHTTETDCKYIGKVDIPLSNNGKGQSRKPKCISVSMNFGGTEVEVKVTDSITTKCLRFC